MACTFIVRSCWEYCSLHNTMSSTRQKKRIIGFRPRNSCASLKESVYSQVQALACAGLILAFSTVQKRRVRWASRLTLGCGMKLGLMSEPDAPMCTLAELCRRGGMQNGLPCSLPHGPVWSCFPPQSQFYAPF